MKTSLYVPIVDFIVNNEDGNKLIYENIVQSGPAYNLVVHESESWLKIKENMPRGDLIEIINEKEANEYKDLVHRYFAPITESIPYYDVSGNRQHRDNLTLEMRRALSYILIANDYKARIYDNSILHDTSELSGLLKQHGDVFPEEGIERVEFVEALLGGYHTESVDTISINKDARIYHDLMDLLDSEEIQLLSTKNALFGKMDVHKDLLIRDIREFITYILQEELLPYLVQAPLLSIAYLSETPKYMFILSYLSGFGATLLKGLDVREYAPPIQDPRLFTLATGSPSAFMYTWFNYEYKLLIPGR